MPPSAPEATAQTQMRSAVDEQDLDARVVALDADGPIAECRLEVALPGIARLQDVAVGIDGQRLRGGVSRHAMSPVIVVPLRTW